MCQGLLDEERGTRWADALDYTRVNDQHGEFRLTAAHYDGYLTVVARAKGYIVGFEPLENMLFDTVEDVVIGLEKGSVLKGTVVDAADAPVAGAYVFVGPPPNTRVMGYEDQARATSAEDGTFVIISLAPDDRSVSAALRSYVPGVAEIPTYVTRDTRVKIVLPAKGARITGTVKIDGELLAGASVTVHPVPRNGASGSFRGRTDENGRYLVEKLPMMNLAVAVGLDYEDDKNRLLRVWLSAEADLESGGTWEVDFDYSPGNAAVEGQVLIAGRTASIETTVRATSSDNDGIQVTCSTSTDEHGFYSLAGLREGPAELRTGGPLFGRFREVSRHINLVAGETVTQDLNVED